MVLLVTSTILCKTAPYTHWVVTLGGLSHESVIDPYVCLQRLAVCGSLLHMHVFMLSQCLGLHVKESQRKLFLPDLFLLPLCWVMRDWWQTWSACITEYRVAGKGFCNGARIQALECNRILTQPLSLT